MVGTYIFTTFQKLDFEKYAYFVLSDGLLFV